MGIVLSVRFVAVAQLSQVQLGMTTVGRMAFALEKQDAFAHHTKCRKPNCG